jgi:Putative polyhydroxyalkanoic acid system protein (PHA_gran_rgn)
MPGMTIEVPHSLGNEEAKRRIEGLLGDVKREFGDRITDLEEKWTGDQATFSFRAMGFGVSGTLAIEPSLVRLSGKLPMAALPFRGRIEQVIRERATALLSGWQAGTVESAGTDE